MQDEDFTEDTGRPSKTKQKEVMHELRDLGAELVELSVGQLKRINLPENIYDTVRERFRKHGGFILNKKETEAVRKVLMTIETWDFDRISDQQRIFGRTKDEGAPLSGEKEFDTPDFALKADGAHVIDPASHIALAAPENNGGVKILRRSYNFTDGLNDQGLLDAGLLFISYQNDPQHFVDLQNKLGRFDLLNEYIRHIGSAVFAVPPGPATGSYIGKALFD